MRVFSRIATLSLGVSLFAGACSDEDPGPVVNEDLTWQVCRLRADGSCERSENFHTQEDADFKVTCKQSAGLWEFTITDPGNPMVTGRRSGSLRVRAINPKTLDCSVEARDANENNDQVPFTGACKQECNMTVLNNDGNWDLALSISCNRLRMNSLQNSAPYSLSASAGNVNTPVTVRLGNCD
jgi:hypothetical protein